MHDVFSPQPAHFKRHDKSAFTKTHFVNLNWMKSYSFPPLLVAVAAAALNVASLAISLQIGPISTAKSGCQIACKIVAV
jgi:hypothetical protein